MDQADVVLLERWVERRDAEAFQALVRRHSAMVFSVCRRVLGDAARAEDVTQECFLKLATGDAKPGAFLGPWLHKMATRRCLDTLRSEGRRRAREERYVAQGPQSVEVRWEALEPLIDEALAQLPERYRVAVTAHFLEGLTHEEVAQRLGIPRYTVSYRIARGLERLGAWLRSRGVNVASGVLVARLGEMPLTQVPPDLAASLSKMALARAARAVPHAHWASMLVTGHGASALVAVLVAAAGLVGVAHVVGGREGDRQPAIATQQAVRPTAEAAARVEKTVLDRAGAGSAALIEPASNIAPSGGTTTTAEEESEPGVLAGSVVDEDGQPIPNATLRVLLVHRNLMYVWGIKDTRSTKTDGKGLFRLADVPSNRSLLLNVTAEGFNSPDSKSIHLEPGEAREGLRIVLSKGITLTGKVIDRDGLPAPGALVILRSFDTDSTSANCKNATAETDERGVFKLGFPEECLAALRVMTRQSGVGIFEVDVQAGAVVELRIPASAGLKGHITRADGTPASQVELEFRPVSERGAWYACFQTRTGVDGSYSLSPLPSGFEYRAVVQDESSKPLSSEQSLGVLAAGTVKEWNFCLGGSAHVRGTVTGEQTGRPQKGARLGWMREREVGRNVAWAEDDGTYEMDLRVPGVYWIFPVPAGGDWDMEFAQRYGRSVTVAMGAEYTVDLCLPDAFSLGVRVVDGQGNPIQGALVEAKLPPKPNSSNGFGNAPTDASGRFRFEGYRPGYEGWIAAHLPDANPLAGVSNTGTGARDAETSHVVGEPGVDYPEETVVLYGAAGLRGVALGPDGSPLADCRIAVHMNAAGIVVDGAHVGAVKSVIYVESDARGAFALPRDVPGTSLDLWVHASGPDGESYSVSGCRVECVAGQVADLGTLTFTADAAGSEIRVGAALVTESE